MSRPDDLSRIGSALERAGRVLEAFTAGDVQARRKAGGDPVTEADLAVNQVLLAELPRGDEGWLSEETTDSPERMQSHRVWVVDPLDGTKEFVQGVPEWCVSVGLVEQGVAVAGGILVPATGQLIVGSRETGVTLNGEPCSTRPVTRLDGAEILASRSEVGRGEWKRFDDAPFQVRPCGSVAYKMALVAAGLTDGTWTLVPKHEWDVAGGTALVLAAGGAVWTLDGAEPRFNRPAPKFPGLFATAPGLVEPIRAML